MSTEPVQLPGNLPPGATLDSTLNAMQFAIWQQLAPSTAVKHLRILRRRGIVTGNREFKIHPRTFLFHQGPKFREALTQ